MRLQAGHKLCQHTRELASEPVIFAFRHRVCMPAPAFAIFEGLQAEHDVSGQHTAHAHRPPARWPCAP
eukprot:11924547-Alexandrium_andersonii.AAC.1